MPAGTDKAVSWLRRRGLVALTVTHSRSNRPFTELNGSTGGPEPLQFVGRRDELRVLRGILTGASTGAGRVVLMTGETGVGKTRLCREALTSTHTRIVVHASLKDSQPSMPLTPIIDSLRATRRHPHHHVWAALRSRARVLSALLPELSTDVRDAPAPGDQHLLFESVLDAVEEASKHSGTVWLLDGMQWADEASWAFVSYAARQIADRRLILIVVYSADEIAPGHPGLTHAAELATESAVIELSVERLSAAETERLVQGSLGPELPAEIVAQIVEQSVGNPRLAKELVALRLKGSDELVPDSVRLTARRRSAGLSASATELLKVVAVVGSEADIDLVLSLTPTAGDSEVAQLVESGLINFQTTRGRAALRFTHPLLRNAVYEEIGWVERRTLHLEVARALERELEGPDLAARLAMVAEHRRLGGEVEAALHVLTAGAEAQRRLGDSAGAGTLSLAAVKLASDDSHLLNPRRDVIWEALRSLSQAGKWTDMLPLAKQAWAERGYTTRVQAAELASYLAAGLFMTDRVDEGWALVDSEIARLESTGDTLKAPVLLGTGAAMSAYMGNWERSRRISDIAAKCTEPGVRQLAECLLLFNEFHDNRDREASAQRYLAVSEQARTQRRPMVEALASWNHARMTTVIADAHESEAIGDRSCSWLGSLSRLLLVGLHLLEGRPRPAAETLELVRTELQHSAPLLTPLLDAVQAHLHLHRGDLDDARSLLQPWASGSYETSAWLKGLIAGACGWLAWEDGDLALAAEHLSRCTDVSSHSGYGLCELGPLLLPLQIDVLVRLDRQVDANTALLSTNAVDRVHDRFFRAAHALASFRLMPSLAAGLEAERLAASAPWPWMAGLAACWRAEVWHDVEAAQAAWERFASIGSTRGVERATAILRRMGARDRGLTHRKSGAALSDRELQVAELVAEGLTNQAIGGRLFLSRTTVATHVKHLLAKLGVSSRVQIAAWLAEQRAGNRFQAATPLSAREAWPTALGPPSSDLNHLATE